MNECDIGTILHATYVSLILAGARVANVTNIPVFVLVLFANHIRVCAAHYAGMDRLIMELDLLLR